MGLSGGVEPAIWQTMNAKIDPNPTELHATIKLGIDAHAKLSLFTWMHWKPKV